MRVRFKLKQDTLNTAAVFRPAPEPGIVIQQDFYVEAWERDKAFDEAAIKFAGDWLEVEYLDE